MSKYDEERKQILQRMQAGNVSFASPSATVSKYDDERAGMQTSGSKYDEERKALANPVPEVTLPDEMNLLNTLRRHVPPSFENKPEIKGKTLGQRIMGTAKDIGQGLADFPEAFTKTLSFGGTDAFARAIGQQSREEQQARDQRIGGKIGTYAGYVGPGGAADAAANLLVRPIVRNLPKVAKGAIRLGAGGTLFGVADEAGQALTGENKQTLGERAGDVAISTGVAAGIGAASPLLRQLGQWGLNAVKGAMEGAQKPIVAAIDSTLRSDLPANVKRGNGQYRREGDSVAKTATTADAAKMPVSPSTDPAAAIHSKGAREVLRKKGEELYQKWEAIRSEKPAVFGQQRYKEKLDEIDREIEHIDSLMRQLHPNEPVPDDVIQYLAKNIAPDVATTAEARQAPAQGVQEATQPANLTPNISGAKAEISSPVNASALTMMQKHFPDGRVDPEKMKTLPYEDRVKLQRELSGDQPANHPESFGIDDPSTIIAKELQIFDTAEMKDLSGPNAYLRDMYRNVESVLGKDVAKPYLESFNQAKAANIDMQKYWVDRLKTEVVDRLGIKKDSKLSALVQKYGEKKVTLQELQEQAPKDWEKIVEADSWFRKAYDNLVDIVNDSRAKVYPDNPDKIVPKRSDYYRHFRELNGLEGLKNLFETPAAIDPSLAGVSDFTQPKSKFAGFMQKRGLGPYKNDAVGGFLNYIPAASYATHVDPQISVFRSLADAVEGSTGDSRNMNTFIEYLRDFANDLSGKTNPADRFPQKFIGRKTMSVLNWVNNRVASNTILGNVGSVLAQTANIPVGLAYAKQYAVPGLGRAVAAAFRKDEAMANSGFLKERFAGKMYRQFDTDWLSVRNPLGAKRFAEWMMETADQLGTSFVWNSAYAKSVAEKAANPIAEADDVTRKLISGRGVGEAPLLLKSNVGKLLLPFQLEVNNLWRVMGDFVRKKDFTGIAVLFTANWLFNRGMEEVRGSGVTFDPIQATIEALAPDLTGMERAGRVGGEILSNLPGGQTIASILVDNGYNRKKIFGNNDPTRFGTGIPAARIVQSSIDKDFAKTGAFLLPGFGGNQILKTSGGVEAAQDGGSFSGTGQLKFPIDMSPANVAKLLLFGPNSTAEARTYYGNDRRPLSEKDTSGFLQSDDPQNYYGGVMKRRELERIQNDIRGIGLDEELSQLQKQTKVQSLIKKFQEALKEGSAQ